MWVSRVSPLGGSLSKSPFPPRFSPPSLLPDFLLLLTHCRRLRVQSVTPLVCSVFSSARPVLRIIHTFYG
ncbi:hypothetical protein GE061_011241 [Apolygus lucorum]|uniref:Uncharacterized protein n=1 Tax=Apolygus lucorum TaxID=248454 RepID=A0A8S9XYX6_APOLU|nr:hypothetical protein GE061_011241 [Apolygus lucorum]